MRISWLHRVVFAMAAICLMVVIAAAFTSVFTIHRRYGHGNGKVMADLSALSDALEQYKLDVGHYPPTKPGLQALVHKVEHSPKWTRPYIIGVPLDLWHSAPYHYICPGTHGKPFELRITCPDGETLVEPQDKVH